MSNRSRSAESAAPIQEWAANLILSGVGRLDCAITALGCIVADLDHDPEGNDASEIESLHWLYEALREEALNIRQCVKTAQDPASCVAKLLVAAEERA